MYCSKCGAENPDEETFCSKCGASLQKPQRPTSSDPSSGKSKPSLWNANAVASWSILFTPIFGSYLNAKNWQELGEGKRAKSSKKWLYISIGVVIVCAFLSESVALGVAAWLLVIWYFAAGRKQSKYIKAELNNEYQKKAWGKPIMGGIAVLLGTVFTYGIFGGNHYDQHNDKTLYSQAFNHVLDHEQRVADYISSDLTDINDGKLAAKKYISELIYQCEEGHISFTNSIYGLTLWHYKDLLINGWNAPIKGDHSNEYTKGIFSIPAHLLDEQARMNNITSVAGYNSQRDAYSYYRYYNFGSDLTSNVSDQWGPWVERGDESKLGYPPSLDFKIFRQDDAWTTSPNTGKTYGLFRPLINEISLVDDVVASSTEAKAIIEDLNCTKYTAQ